MSKKGKQKTGYSKLVLTLLSCSVALGTMALTDKNAHADSTGDQQNGTAVSVASDSNNSQTSTVALANTSDATNGESVDNDSAQPDVQASVTADVQTPAADTDSSATTQAQTPAVASDSSATSGLQGREDPEAEKATINTYVVGTSEQIEGGFLATDVNTVDLSIDGVDQNNPVWPKDGIFTYYADNLITSANQNVVIKAYNLAGDLLSETQVPLSASTGSVAVDNSPFQYNTGGALLATKTGDVAFIRTRINGEFVDADTTYPFLTLPMVSYFYDGTLTEMIQNGTWDGKGADINLELVGFDRKGNEISITPIRIIGVNESSWQQDSDSGVKPATTSDANQSTGTPATIGTLPTDGVNADGTIDINAANFPDENFRNYILNHITFGQSTVKEDTLSVLKTLDVRNQGIADLTGIQYFTGLETLDASYNKLTWVDTQHNTALTHLNISNNLITNVNVSDNSALTQLDIYNNYLDTLDVTKNTNLIYLYASHNNLSSIDVSQNTNLKNLIVAYNKLSSLDVSNNSQLYTLWAFNNNLTSLDVTHNAQLFDLFVRDNELTSLDISQNPILKHLTFYDNSMPTLDVTHNSDLTEMAASPQYLNADLTKNDVGKYVVDVAEISGESWVDIISSDWTFDQTTGDAIYTGSGTPTKLIVRYNYRHAGEVGDFSDFPLVAVIRLAGDTTTDPDDGDTTTPTDPDNGDDGDGTTTPTDPDNGDDGDDTTTPTDPDNGDDGDDTTTPTDPDNGDDGDDTTTPTDPDNGGDGDDTTTPSDTTDGETTNNSNYSSTTPTETSTNTASTSAVNTNGTASNTSDTQKVAVNNATSSTAAKTLSTTPKGTATSGDLPQTGEKETTLAAELGVLLLSMFGFIGLARRKSMK